MEELRLRGRSLETVLVAFAVAAVATPAWSASGAFERTWGYDVDAANLGTGYEVCTVAADCKQGINFGYAGGSLNGGNAIGTGRAGEVYVGEVGNSRIEKFDSVYQAYNALTTDAAIAGARIGCPR